MKVAAPGKIILSGEHAVVYGEPAIALAINRYVSTTITKEKHPGILFDFADLQHRARVSTKVLQLLKARLKDKYRRFKQGDISISRVLKKPIELAQFAFGTVTDALNLSLPQGIKIHIESTIPMGCGMGSSAATIVSVMYAISNYLERPLSEDEFFKLAQDAENLQHGASSGIDLRVALQGGCLFFKDKQPHKRPMPPWPIYLVNTGMPESSTGQCVSHAATFLKDKRLLQEFSQVTTTMDRMIEENDFLGFKEMIRKNHDLLTHIQVVPEKVKNFITDIEKLRGAAKISGAGSIYGQSSGIVIVFCEQHEELKQLITQNNYQLLNAIPTSEGVHSVYT